MPIVYRMRTVPLVATIVVMVIAILLGQWQTRRAEEKDAIEIKLVHRSKEPPLILKNILNTHDIEYRKIVVKGRFRRDWPVYLDNRPYKSSAGLYILMPFQISDTANYVLILHGWMPRNSLDRNKLLADTTPAGIVEIEGIVRRNAGRILQLGTPEPLQPKSIVQNVDIDEFSKVSKMNMQPFLIEQISDTHDGLVRDWPRPSLGSDKNRAYAFQWYALAIMAIIFYVATGLRRGKE